MEAVKHHAELCPQARRAGSPSEASLKDPGRALPAPCSLVRARLRAGQSELCPGAAPWAGQVTGKISRFCSCAGKAKEEYNPISVFKRCLGLRCGVALCSGKAKTPQGPDFSCPGGGSLCSGGSVGKSSPANVGDIRDMV